jgi:Poxvirus A32 protein
MTLRQVKVVPPQPKKTKDIEDNTAPFLPRKYFSGLAIGKRLSGKSSLLTFCLTYPHGGWLENYSEILIFSPTIQADPQWSTVIGHEKVSYSETVTGEQLEAIMTRQKARYKKSKKNSLLIILDDLSSTIKNKKSGLEKALNKYYSTCRHVGCSIFLSAQTLSHLSTTIRGNATNLFIFRVVERERKVLSAEHASLRMPEKEFMQFLKESTEEPFSFANVNWQSKDLDLIYTKGFCIKDNDDEDFD